MPKPNDYARAEFRTGEILGEKIAKRGAINEVAKRDLLRYYHLLESELDSCHFSEAEASFLADALNGLHPKSNPHLLWAEVADAGEELGPKWGIEPDALAFKLKKMSPSQQMAVFDAIERFWQGDGSYHIPSMADQLRKVGLIR